MLPRWGIHNYCHKGMHHSPPISYHRQNVAQEIIAIVLVNRKNTIFMYKNKIVWFLAVKTTQFYNLEIKITKDGMPLSTHIAYSQKETYTTHILLSSFWFITVMKQVALHCYSITHINYIQHTEITSPHTRTLTHTNSQGVSTNHKGIITI